MKKELCEHCGASLMVNSYPLNKTLVSALKKMAENPGKKTKQMPFTKSEYSVYTKLKFWGLISRREDGYWFVTENGRQFLLNRLKVPKEISYFRNELLEDDSEEKISIKDVFPTEESKQKYREKMTPVNQTELDL